MDLQPHRYDSGVYHDTAPSDVISCCHLPHRHPIHDVECPRCGHVHSLNMPCYKPKHRKES